eukprot:scaffold283107_cov40-Tisochrysis_lutea.AAC.4
MYGGGYDAGGFGGGYDGGFDQFGGAGGGFMGVSTTTHAQLACLHHPARCSWGFATLRMTLRITI